MKRIFLAVIGMSFMLGAEGEGCSFLDQLMEDKAAEEEGDTANPDDPAYYDNTDGHEPEGFTQSAVIGVEGGTVGDDFVGVIVPAGAVTEEVEISLTMEPVRRDGVMFLVTLEPKTVEFAVPATFYIDHSRMGDAPPFLLYMEEEFGWAPVEEPLFTYEDGPVIHADILSLGRIRAEADFDSGDGSHMPPPPGT